MQSLYTEKSDAYEEIGESLNVPTISSKSSPPLFRRIPSPRKAPR